jgi:hypothetical protein
MHKFLQKIHLGYVLGDFLTNSSGHPDRRDNRIMFCGFVVQLSQK